MNTYLPFFPIVFLAACGGSPSDEASESASAAVSSPAAKLVFADARNHGCSSCVTWTAVIEVEDLAYEKDVTVVAKYPTDGTYGAGWTEHKAKFLRSLPGNRELWTVDGFGGIGGTQFAVRYRASGKEYWDNNGGKDYRGHIESQSRYGTVGVASPMGPGIDVAVTQASASFPHRGMEGNALYVDALVRNRTPSKSVKLVYTTDGWKTSHVAEGDYRWGDHEGGERWRLFTYFGSATKIEFSVVAEQNGTQAWDNNYGQNFECHAEGPGFVCSGAAFTR